MQWRSLLFLLGQGHVSRMEFFVFRKWNCKYHIVFAPKYRRKIIYGQLKRDIANILSMLCKRKGVKIVEAEVCPDHIHMLVEILPSISVSSFVGYLKGKSILTRLRVSQ